MVTLQDPHLPTHPNTHLYLPLFKASSYNIRVPQLCPPLQHWLTNLAVVKYYFNQPISCWASVNSSLARDLVTKRISRSLMSKSRDFQTMSVVEVQQLILENKSDSLRLLRPVDIWRQLSNNANFSLLSQLGCACVVVATKKFSTTKKPDKKSTG